MKTQKEDKLSIVFLSNFLNHHQLPLCMELYRLSGGKFQFIATEAVERERLAMGYADMNNDYDFVIKFYEDRGKELAEKILIDADVVIIGGVDLPFRYVHKRLKKKKLTFFYSERIFRAGWKIKPWDPRMIRYMYRNFIRYDGSNYFLLCAGSYVWDDFKRYRIFKDRAIKWGYFPKGNDALSNKDTDDAEIKVLFVGRSLALKHPEKAVFLFEQLIQRGYKANLTMIGQGEMRPVIEDQISALGLTDFITLIDKVNYEDVLEYMNQADIFLFLSGAEEGWGAVLNEAMSCGCAVLASRDAGATDYLIKDGENGFSYRNSDEMYDKFFQLAENAELRMKIGEQAYHTINKAWSYRIAAERLYSLSQKWYEGNLSFYDNGPCSPAWEFYEE